MRRAMVDLSKYLTVRQAAKRLDLTEGRVQEPVVLRQIRAIKVRQWRIKPEDLETSVRSRMNKQ